MAETFFTRGPAGRRRAGARVFAGREGGSPLGGKRSIFGGRGIGGRRSSTNTYQAGIARLRAVAAARGALKGIKDINEIRGLARRRAAEEEIDWQHFGAGVHNAQARAARLERPESGVIQAGSALEVLHKVIGKEVQNKRRAELFVRDLLGEIPGELQGAILQLGPQRSKAILEKNPNFQRVIRMLSSGQPISSEESGIIRHFTAELRSSLVESLEKVAQQEAGD